MYAYVNNDPVNFIDPKGKNAIAIIRAALVLVQGVCAFKAGYDLTSDFTNNTIIDDEIEQIDKTLKEKRDKLLGLAQQKNQDSKCRNDQGQLIADIAKLEKEIVDLNSKRANAFQTLVSVISDLVCASAAAGGGK